MKSRTILCVVKFENLASCSLGGVPYHTVCPDVTAEMDDVSKYFRWIYDRVVLGFSLSLGHPASHL